MGAQIGEQAWRKAQSYIDGAAGAGLVAQANR
jgi:hypothetical protein